jgi:hypothetical protein
LLSQLTALRVAPHEVEHNRHYHHSDREHNRNREIHLASLRN